MERPGSKILRIGEWRVDPASGQISRNGETARLEARTMRLLIYLAERSGEVVSIDDLLNRVWSGVIVTPDSVYQAVASLRRQLGDDHKQPTYIATVPRLGYRMVAAVGTWTERSNVEGKRPTSRATPSDASKRRNGVFMAAGATTLCLIAAAVLLFHSRFSSTRNQASAAVVPAASVGVLPFLDLTEGMQEEEFADGVTEELITRLSKVPGLRVPAPTSSFYLKGKQIPIADMAKALNVNYLVDGSVRKSGSRVRVAARLLRAENGYVIWSETYDRSLDDILMVQDDIAGNVTKALTMSLGEKPERDSH